MPDWRYRLFPFKDHRAHELAARYGALIERWNPDMAFHAPSRGIEFLDEPAEIDVEAPAPHGHLCEACGAPVEPWDNFCTACGAPQDVAPPPVDTATAEARKHFRCENCGAEVATDPDQRSYICPFCDSTYVVEYSPQE